MPLMMQPTEYYNRLVPTSQAEILTNHSPAIGAIIRMDKGDSVVKALLVKAIVNLNGYFNIKYPMNETQMIEVINLICKKKAHFKLDDFKLCFENIKVGIYGSCMHKIDGEFIFKCLNEYDSERMVHAENINIMQHNQFKQGLGDKSEPNKDGQKKIAEIFKNTLKSIDTEKPVENKKRNSGSDFDRFAQRALKQFDFIYNTHRDKRGQRFVKRNGIAMTQSEYLDFKVEQYKRVMKLLTERKKH